MASKEIGPSIFTARYLAAQATADWLSGGPPGAVYCYASRKTVRDRKGTKIRVKAKVELATNLTPLTCWRRSQRRLAISRRTILNKVLVAHAGAAALWIWEDPEMRFEHFPESRHRVFWRVIDLLWPVVRSLDELFQVACQLRNATEALFVIPEVWRAAYDLADVIQRSGEVDGPDLDRFLRNRLELQRSPTSSPVISWPKAGAEVFPNPNLNSHLFAVWQPCADQMPLSNCGPLATVELGPPKFVSGIGGNGG
jgi:hypothetical protein